ncbi:MAG: hypothetical protein ACPG7F_12700 [Aggregatilineales bacterium]
MRVFNALIAAREFIDAGDYVDIIFDGAGVRSAIEIADPEHPIYGAFKEVEEHITGLCRFCSAQYEIEEESSKRGFKLLSDNYQHPGFRNFLINDYKILNF